jgi:hypothetical protein
MAQARVSAKLKTGVKAAMAKALVSTKLKTGIRAAMKAAAPARSAPRKNVVPV